MKKSVIILSILLLGVAMTASPSLHKPTKLNELIKKAQEKGVQMDTKYIPKTSRVKRGSDTCTRIDCVAPEKECTEDGSYCQAGTTCLGGTCRTHAIGDECNSNNECSGNVKCNSGTGKCVRKSGLGKGCLSSNDCVYGLDCSSSSRTCIESPTKIGDACESSTTSHNCPSGMTCSGNVCVEIPSAVGDACVESVGCAGKLYCDTATSTCQEYPKAGQPCHEGECYTNLTTSYYCDTTTDTCKEYKTEGDTCSDDDLCDSTYYYCNDSNTCQKYETDEPCSSDSDCSGPQACFNSKCVEIFTLDDGEECPYSNVVGIFSIDTNAFLCKEGYGCVPDRTSDSKYVCKKIETQFNDALSCKADNDCPEDSYCYCNTETGAMQCMPYMASSMENYYISVEYITVALMCAFGGECDEDKLIELSGKYYNLTDPSYTGIRCHTNYSYVPPELPPEPSSSSSSVTSAISESGSSADPNFAGEIFVVPLVYLLALIMMAF